jgi:hypothetical protein
MKEFLLILLGAILGSLLSTNFLWVKIKNTILLLKNFYSPTFYDKILENSRKDCSCTNVKTCENECHYKTIKKIMDGDAL